MVAWPAMDAAPEPAARAPGLGTLVFAGLVGMVLLWAAVAGDGSGFGATLPVGGAAVLLLLGAVVAVALGRLAAPPVGRSGLVLVLVFVVLVAWTGVTVWWSIVPDRSWDVSNRGMAFAAFLGLGIVVAGAVGTLAARIGALLLAAVSGVVVGWALLAKAIPALDPEGDRVARLREPVGYWNAVAVVGLWLALSSERLAGGLLLAASAAPAALVGAWAFTRPALVEDVALRS